MQSLGGEIQLTVPVCWRDLPFLQSQYFPSLSIPLLLCACARQRCTRLSFAAFDWTNDVFSLVKIYRSAF